MSGWARRERGAVATVSQAADGGGWRCGWWLVSGIAVILIVGLGAGGWLFSPLFSGSGLLSSSEPASALVLPPPATGLTMRSLQDEAFEVAERLQADYPEVPEALHVLAMLHAGLRQRGRAEELWRRCIQLAPSEAIYSINAAGAAVDQGRGEEAVEILEAALEAGSEPAGVYHQLAAVLNQLGRLDEAEEALLKVLELYPESAEDWYLLGQTQSKRGDYAAAEASLYRALELAPAPVSALHVLANVSAARGKSEQAAKYREHYRQLKAAPPRQLTPEGSTRMRRERYLGESLRIALLTLDEAATVYTRQGDWDRAEGLRLRSLALDPTSTDMLRELAVLYVDQQRFADAQVVLVRLTELEPDNAIEQWNLAQIAAQAGDPGTAEAAYRRVLDLQPDAAGAHLGLAQLYRDLGRFEQARWAAEEAARWSPTADSFRLLADICRRTGDHAAAQAAQERADRLRSPEDSSSLGGAERAETSH